MSANLAQYAVTAGSNAVVPSEIAADLCGQLGPRPAVVLFFVSSSLDFASVAKAIHAQFPDALSVGCTTAGEIGPSGVGTGGVTALGLGEPARCAARLVDLDNFQFGGGDQLVQSLAKDLGVLALDADRHLFVTLTDGLSGMEEVVIASLHTWAPAVSLVGGSAADDFTFTGTWVAVNGDARTKAAVVMALEPGVQFHAFILHHYQPTPRQVVVTAADPEHRMVHELDGWPASKVLAEILGIPTEDASRRESFDVSFAFEVGGICYMRGVMAIEGTSLRMGGAVEEGVVLRVMSPGDIVAETRLGVAHALAQVPGPAQAMLLFNCAGRMLEAANSGCTAAVAQAMAPVRSVGFTTYGEQYGPMTVNHTLTGLVLGSR